MSKKEKERVKQLLRTLREKVSKDALPVVAEIEKIIGHLRKEMSAANCLLNEVDEASKSHKEKDQRISTLEQQVAAANGEVRCLMKKQHILREKLTLLEKEQEQRRRKYPTLSHEPMDLEAWGEVEYEFPDNKHTILACICPKCYLHFHVFTWRVNTLLPRLRCPECGWGPLVPMLIPVRGPIYAEWGYGACGLPPKGDLHKDGGQHRDARTAARKQRENNEEGR